METHDKKNPCSDCRHCQWCSEDRCRLCLPTGSGRRKKLSMAEQIALFEQINRSEPEFGPCCADTTPPALRED